MALSEKQENRQARATGKLGGSFGDNAQRYATRSRSWPLIWNVAVRDGLPEGKNERRYAEYQGSYGTSKKYQLSRFTGKQVLAKKYSDYESRPSCENSGNGCHYACEDDFSE